MEVFNASVVAHVFTATAQETEGLPGSQVSLGYIVDSRLAWAKDSEAMSQKQTKKNGKKKGEGEGKGSARGEGRSEGEGRTEGRRGKKRTKMKYKHWSMLSALT